MLVMTEQSDIPRDSSPPTYPKRDLPTFSSTTPHGPISGHPRSPEAQKALEARKAEILRTMNGEQIEQAYQEKVKQIKELMEKDRAKNEEIDREVAKLTAQMQLEKRLYWRQKEERAIRERRKGSGENGGKEEGET
jgi:hypothetical protein